MFHYIRTVTRDAKDRGASAVEYGLMVAAIAAVIVGIVFGLGGVVQDVFTDTCTTVEAGVTAANPNATQGNGGCDGEGAAEGE